ncbi:MAG: polysaccharide biosynthesis/export family protein [Verrucomicrobiota bacterium]
MNRQRSTGFSPVNVAVLLVLAFLFVGCADLAAPAPAKVPDVADAMSADFLRPGDRIRVVFNDIPDAPVPAEEVIPEDGRIILPRGVEVVVIGKKRTDVEKEIAKIYVEDKKLYTKITANIERMASFISVGGEVRNPSSVMFRGDMTVTAAIASAGGFSEYANRSGVIITRAANKKQVKVNVRRAVNNPELDLILYPGDQVYVPRSKI